MRNRRIFQVVMMTATLAAGSLGFHAAGASSLLRVTVLPGEPVPAGTEAALTVRATGDQPELASLSYEVEGGELTGAVGLNAVAPGVADAVVLIRRATPGDAVLTVRTNGATLATGVAHFSAVGSVRVSVTLAADAHASARTWRFEVSDSSGTAVANLSIGTSGTAPTGVGVTPALPYGRYTVRQLLGNDTRTSCSDGAFYTVASAATGVELAGPAADVAFQLRPCPGAPTRLNVNVPIDTLGPDAGPEAPIDEVRGVRSAGPAAPLPPNTGTGLAMAEAENASQSNSLFVILLAASVAGVLPGAWLAGRKVAHLQK